MKSIEYILSDFGLPLGGGAAELIEIAIEPVIYLFVNNMIVIAYFLGSLLFLEGLDLSGRAVLVRAAHVQRVVAHEAAVAGEDVRTQHAPDDVTQVRHVVHVREGARDQHVSLIRLGEDQAWALDTVDLGVGL